MPVRWDWQDFPPWLSSFIFHSLALIVLALVMRQAATPPAEMAIEWDPGGANGDDLGAGGGGEPSKLADENLENPQWAMESADLATPLAELDPALREPTSEFADPTDAVTLSPVPQFADALGDGPGGAGGGTGGGRGGGHGSGVGNGDAPGVARTSMFGLEGEGSRFAYVFDRSQSMNSVFTLTSEGRSASITSLKAAKAELIHSLEKLADASKFQLIFYNDEPLMFTDAYAADGVFTATADAKALATDFIKELRGEGNTNHQAALVMALRSKPQIMFLLTDGEAKDDPSPVELRRLIKMCKRAGTKVNLIQFEYVPRSQNPLIGLAKATGGQHVSISIRGLVQPTW